jgi:hypothetical protein
LEENSISFVLGPACEKEDRKRPKSMAVCKYLITERELLKAEPPSTD